MSAEHKRRLALHLEAEEFRTTNLRRTLSKWKRREFHPECRLPLNMKKLVGGLVSLGHRVEDIGLEFGMDTHTTSRLWKAFEKLPEETHVRVFRDASLRRSLAKNRKRK